MCAKLRIAADNCLFSDPATNIQRDAQPLNRTISRYHRSEALRLYRTYSGQLLAPTVTDSKRLVLYCIPPPLRLSCLARGPAEGKPRGGVSLERGVGKTEQELRWRYNR